MIENQLYLCKCRVVVSLANSHNHRFIDNYAKDDETGGLIFISFSPLAFILLTLPFVI